MSLKPAGPKLGMRELACHVPKILVMQGFKASSEERGVGGFPDAFRQSKHRLCLPLRSLFGSYLHCSIV